METRGGFFALELIICLAQLCSEPSCLQDAQSQGAPWLSFFHQGKKHTQHLSTHKTACAPRQRQACFFILNSFTLISDLTRERKKPLWLCQQDHHPSRQLAKRV